MQESILGIKNTIDEMETSVTENVKSKTLLTQHIEKIWHIEKLSNLRIIGIEEKEASYLKDTENIINKIIKKNT